LAIVYFAIMPLIWSQMMLAGVESSFCGPLRPHTRVRAT